MAINAINKFQLPQVIFGTSSLGNLYQAIPYETKLAIVKECIDHSPGIPMFDSAGKYGAGLALETLGKCLKDLGVKSEEVLISNKLRWYRTPLTTTEPTFEKDVSVINSAVFNGGFLIGSDFYNYKEVNRALAEGQVLFKWRDAFFALCKQYEIQPAEACFNYGFNIPGVKSVALNTSKPENVKKNITMATKRVPENFWAAMVEEGLLET